MSLYIGDSDYVSFSIPANTSQKTTMMSSSELALTGIYPPQDFTSLKALKDVVTTKAIRLNREGHHESQYISLKNVGTKDFNQIKANCAKLGSAIHLIYFPDIETLIIKVPTKLLTQILACSSMKKFSS